MLFRSHARGLAERSVLAALVEQGERWIPIPISEIIDRFPGLAAGIFGVVGQLVGNGAEVELGEL